MSDLFKNFDYSKFKNMPPPKDNSLKTMSEIKDINKIPVNKSFIKKRDDIKKSFINLAIEKNIDIDKKEIDNLINSSANVILKLKKHYNRPRPKELAKVFGIKINNVELESMKTPSYPSGHSAQGFLIGNFLSNKHKEKDFKKIGEEISESRNMAKAHYKSDSDMGKKLGQSMFNYLNKEDGKS
tara:strand:- start:1216 stop:1767 length:552 start_codon:yes stop_codon:yes gene_type:complete